MSTFSFLVHSVRSSPPSDVCLSVCLSVCLPKTFEHDIVRPWNFAHIFIVYQEFQRKYIYILAKYPRVNLLYQPLYQNCLILTMVHRCQGIWSLATVDILNVVLPSDIIHGKFQPPTLIRYRDMPCRLDQRVMWHHINRHISRRIRFQTMFLMWIWISL